MSSPIAVPEAMPVTRTSATFAPPIIAASRWLEGVSFSQERPLINLSQAAPAEPPPLALRQEIARAALEESSAHLYGPVMGLEPLRAEIARQWSHAYGGKIAPSEVAVTSGCNEAFCAAIAAICTEGDEVILPTPWYFNQKMWLDMAGITTVPLPPGTGLLPDPTVAEAAITPRCRAIVLVSPNNPGGVEYPADLLAAFHALARRHGLKLIVDETYRDFDSRSTAPHGIFTDPDWSETFIHLYSFSKAYRLTGHRVGAMVASSAFLLEVEKFLDTVTICPNQLGQIAALWGLRNLAEWKAGERDETLARRATIEAQMPRLETAGWELLGCGAFFAYLRHPFAMSSDELAAKLVREAAVLLLPGTMSYPEGWARGHREVRVAFANVDSATLIRFFDRLEALQSLGWPLAPAPDSP